MSLITYTGLCELVDAGVISDVPRDHINAASIDVTLGDLIWIERAVRDDVRIAQKEAPHLMDYDLSVRDYYLGPGAFALAQTREVFNLPDHIACEFKLKSSCARSGLQHALAGWCDPGWTGSVLTLELKNNLQHHTLVLSSGMKIGQMVFFRGQPVPDHASYAVRGRYNGDRAAQPSKGVQ